jgi:hypothetical protein
MDATGPGTNATEPEAPDTMPESLPNVSGTGPKDAMPQTQSISIPVITDQQPPGDADGPDGEDSLSCLPGPGAVLLLTLAMASSRRDSQTETPREAG